MKFKVLSILALLAVSASVEPKALDKGNLIAKETPTIPEGLENTDLVDLLDELLNRDDNVFEDPNAKEALKKSIYKYIAHLTQNKGKDDYFREAWLLAQRILMAENEIGKSEVQETKGNIMDEIREEEQEAKNKYMLRIKNNAENKDDEDYSKVAWLLAQEILMAENEIDKSEAVL